MQLEESIQITFFEELRYRYKKVSDFVFHIPNGGSRIRKRNKKGEWYCPEGVKLKRMGTKAGVPDVFVMIPNEDYHGLWLEFKSDKGKQQETQKEFESLCGIVKYKYVIARSVEEAFKYLLEYLKVKP